MPWKETDPMKERMRFLVRWSEEATSFAALCREFGISRKTGYKWLDRFEQRGAGGLEDRRPVAWSFPHQTPETVVERLVVARKTHPTWGPRKLRAWLSEQPGAIALPAVSTIGEILKRNGLVRPRKRRLRVPIERLPLAPCGGPNEIWSIDFKGHAPTADGKRFYPLTVLDLYSRYFLKCEALLEPREAPVRAQLELAFREFGLPKRIRSDNGPPFGSTGIGGLTGLVVWLVKLGIVPERIEPGHPEQNGTLERLHRTLKAEAMKPPGANLAAQQRMFDRFRHEYNDERPHEALGDRPPARVYALSLRPFPATLRSPDYDSDVQVRLLDPAGRICFEGKKLLLTRTLGGEPVGLRPVAEGRFELRYGPLVLGVLDARGKEKLRVVPLASKVPEPGNEAPNPGDAPLVTGAGAPVAGYRGALPVTSSAAPATLPASTCDSDSQTMTQEPSNL